MRARNRWFAAAGVFVGTLAVPTLARAQQSIDPTAEPTRPPDNFVNWFSYGTLVLGGLVALAVLAAYLRYSSKYFREADKQAPPSGAPAPPVYTVGQQSRTQPQALAASLARPPLPVQQAPQPGAASAGQAAAASTAAAAPPRQAATPPPAGPEPPPTPPPTVEAETAAGAEQEARTEEVPEAAEAAETAEEAEEATDASPDQGAAPGAATDAPDPSLDADTYQQVLSEQLGKGVDQRIAEGKARAAAKRAAKEKAGG